MTAPCAIEYILVTRWRGGKKGGQNRVCACDTRDRGVNKKLKREHPSETGVMPESGERKRNLTTLVLVKKHHHHECHDHQHHAHLIFLWQPCANNVRIGKLEPQNREAIATTCN